MATPLRVLILEDQPDDAELIRRELRLAGFAIEAQCVDNEAAYLARLDTPPEVILSDYSMVDFNALRALSLLQARGLDKKRLRDEARRAEAETLRQAARATSLLRVAAQLNTGLDLDAVLATVCAETAGAFNVPIASVHLYDEKRA